ncbi:Ysc84 domain-containing protein [Fusarium keratoplasticum]|uniref:Ysc84 domain-containing protein n=1 Tax=Fusarium keratoplasticum TaxID=1328300 RepID=A0ACC0QIR1_9HYPO|nr:Ysc84 domain-containing protein [Fusarium keratoplasticum]KAI8655134.1 Ysc84 domain-containing protein [Fusarium keratoplasticum]
MTVVYSTNEPVDPLKQSGQAPPTYTVEPDYQQPTPSEQQPQDASSKQANGHHFHRISSKAGWPLNKAANLIGAEGWWPTTMDKECNKAARILHNFTNLSSSTPPKTSGPMHPTGLTRKSMVKIPPHVLHRAAGLAIFNVLRAGACHGSLAGGSGVVVARRPDGTWSPPSSFIVSTLGAGFVFGLDVYDCVCVLNTPEQVAAFTKPRLSLGAEGSIAVGPLGTGGSVEATVTKTARPVWSYMKSRGLWAGVQIDGTIIVSRGDANSAFYNERGITARKILTEDVAWPMSAKPLFEVLRAIEGRPDYDRTIVQEVGSVPPPSDAILSEKQERYTDEPELPAQQTREHTEEPKEELPNYTDVKPEVKEEEEEEDTVMSEKEKLTKSGY